MHPLKLAAFVLHADQIAETIGSIFCFQQRMQLAQHRAVGEDRIPRKPSGYHKGDHPRIRMAESELDEQMLALFDSMCVESDEFREEFREGLRSLTNEELRLAKLQDDEIHQAYTRIAEQQSQLLDLRLDEEIDSETYAAKATERRSYGATELRDKAASMALHLEKASRGRYEIIDIVVKAFELSQSLRETSGLTADYAAKRRILEILCLNCSLDGASLCRHNEKAL